MFLLIITKGTNKNKYMNISKLIFISCTLFGRICQRLPNITFLKIFNFKVMYFKNSKKWQRF